MDFIGIILLAIFLYARLQDFAGYLGIFRPALLSLLIACVGVFIRPGGVTWKQIIRTPQDWMVTIYFLYILLLTPGSFGDLWGQIYQFVGFYFLVVIALTNFQRLYQYLGWWLGCILFIAVMALLSLVDIDPLDSASTTAGSLGRLTLNMSLFSSPNALGHSVMVAVPLIYFFMFWRRPASIKAVGLALLTVPLLCAYFTQSTGAFITGFVALALTLVFGRPKWVQILVIIGTVILTVAIIELIPRFREVRLSVGRRCHDEVVTGRLHAFEFGKWAHENTPYGVGYGNFYSAFLRKEGELRARASHSSFNQVQAEFGHWGLLIFCGILYTCFHSLARARTADANEERVRRMLFCMVTCYFVSSWMIDIGFRVAFFVIVAMVSAFHRILMDRAPSYTAPAVTEPGGGWGDIIGLGRAQASEAGGGLALALAADTGVTKAGQVSASSVGPIKDAAATPDQPSPYMPWPRFQWYDPIGIYLSLLLVLQIRDWIIMNLRASSSPGCRDMASADGCQLLLLISLAMLSCIVIGSPILIGLLAQWRKTPRKLTSLTCLRSFLRSWWPSTRDAVSGPAKQLEQPVISVSWERPGSTTAAALGEHPWQRCTPRPNPTITARRYRRAQPCRTRV